MTKEDMKKINWAEIFLKNIPSIMALVFFFVGIYYKVDALQSSQTEFVEENKTRVQYIDLQLRNLESSINRNETEAKLLDLRVERLEKQMDELNK